MKLRSDTEKVGELTEYTHALLAPIPRLSVSEWAEANIVFDERTSAIPGRFSASLTPYIREPLQAYADKTITDLTLCFGTQTAKTTVVMVGTAYRIVNDAVPVLWVMPNADLAKSFSKTRWQQMVEDCEPLKAQKPKKRDLFNNLEQHFAKVTLNFVGSNSASNLASRPAGLLNMDETDKFKENTEREAGALQLAQERTKTFPYPLRVKTSTPTTVTGEIWQEFLLGDQRFYNVPCPHCGSLIILRFRVENEHGFCGLRWWRESEDEVRGEGGEWDMEKVRKSAFYRTQCCGHEIYDYHKPAMLEAGKWIPTNPNAEPRRRSYHLSSLYSLLGRETTFGAIAVAWLQTHGSITKRHNFINSMLAETWDDEKAVDDNPIFREVYEVAELPPDRTPLMAIDVQDNHFWAVVRAFAAPNADRPNGESWQLFADRLTTIEEAVAVQHAFGVESKYVSIDMAKYTNRVAKWVVEFDWRGLWGDDKRGFLHQPAPGQNVQLLWSKVQYRDPHVGTPFQSDRNEMAKYMFWANDPIKDLLAVLRYSDPAIFHVSANAHKNYQKHMNAEQQIVEKLKRSGKYVRRWKQFSRDNHLFDTELMCLVRALQLGLIPMPDGSPVPFQQQFGLS
jgi:hypothetical protein